MLLSVSFIMLATLLDSLYSILAGRIAAYLENHDVYKIQHGVSGVFYICAGTWLALTRRV